MVELIPEAEEVLSEETLELFENMSEETFEEVFDMFTVSQALDSIQDLDSEFKQILVNEVDTQ